MKRLYDSSEGVYADRANLYLQGFTRGAFPYTALTSAKNIRHAVSIDERRAKFRVDLISEGTKQDTEKTPKRPKFHRYLSDLPEMYQPTDEPDEEQAKGPLARLLWRPFDRKKESAPSSQETLGGEPERGDTSNASKGRNKTDKAAASEGDANAAIASPAASTTAVQTEVAVKRQSLRRRFSDLRDPQDILEV